MNEITKERCWVPGFECGECGGWVDNHNPLPCNGDLCVTMIKEETNESNS